MRILALIIGLALPSWGQNTPVIGSYRDFSGGLNNNDASVSIAANESPDLLNVMIDNPPGALVQRKGYQSCGTVPSGNVITNLYEYSKNDGSRKLIVTDNVTVWETADCVTFSTITTGLSNLELPRFATVLDDLWIVNGSTYPIVWDGSTATQLDGVSGRPLGPRAKYISYWKSRVWLANVPTSPSSVFFSALVDTNGVTLDPSTSTGAWISTNQLYINRDDGSPIYGMKPYRDNLYIFKETGINRILFESDFDLSLTKNVSAIGSKFNESIVEMDDGLLRFLSDDGIYAFNGAAVTRLSTKITPTIDDIKQQTGGQGFRIWDTETGFHLGEYSSVADLQAGGADYIVLDVSSSAVYTIDDFSDNNYTSNPVWTFYNGADAFSAAYGLLMYSGDKSVNKNGTIQTPYISGLTEISSGVWQASIKNYNTYGTTAGYYDEVWSEFMFMGESGLKNGYSLEIKMRAAYNQACPITTATLYRLDESSKTTIGSDSVTCSNSGQVSNISCPNIVITKVGGSIAVTDSSCGLSISATDSTYNTGTHYGAKCTLYAGNGWGTRSCEFDDLKGPGFKSSGTYTSEISTFTGLSQWRNFAVEGTLNGQDIDYYVRTGTTAYNVGLASWSPITSGAVISTTTDGYAQWKAEFTTTDNSKTPLLDSVSMGYATGDTSATVVKGIQYKSRYWMAASTGTTNNFNDMVIVESRSPRNTYTIFDLPISAMAIWSGNLYGAIGNTGKIARLDYGDTDDGTAISSYWESRDEVFENPIFQKTVNTVILDYSNSPANTALSVGLSPDEGATYQTRSTNLSASSLTRNTAKLNYEPNTSLGFRTRVSNSVLGVGFKIYGIHPFGTMTPFYGN